MLIYWACLHGVIDTLHAVRRDGGESRSFMSVIREREAVPQLIDSGNDADALSISISRFCISFSPRDEFYDFGAERAAFSIICAVSR